MDKPIKDLKPNMTELDPKLTLVIVKAGLETKSVPSTFTCVKFEDPATCTLPGCLGCANLKLN